MTYTKKQLTEIVTNAYNDYKKYTGAFPNYASCNVEFKNNKGYVESNKNITIGIFPQKEAFFNCKTFKDFLNLFFDDNGQDFKIISFSF